MGSFSIWHWLIVLVVVFILFGRGRLSETMGEFGEGIRNFKRGMNEPDPVDSPPRLATASNDADVGQHSEPVVETADEKVVR